MVLLARPGALAAQPAQAGPLGGSGQRSSGVFAGAPLAASRKSRCRRAAWDRQAHQPSATLTTPPPAAATAAPVARQRSSSPTRRERRQKGSAREEALVRLYTLYTDDAEFHAWSDGAIALYRRTSTGPVLAIRGAATLPWFLARQECTCDESAPGRLVLRWGEEAVMEIYTTESAEHPPEWAKGLSKGFHVSFSIRQPAHPRHRRLYAELAMNLDSAGHWYGGGHLMRQHWPLEKGLWEVGPHYPFDNGPNGVNTLVGGHFVASNGLLVATDPDTPYFHVGLNCPPPRRSWISGGVKKISWGVGIQNFTRQILPLEDDKGRGDGMLRLQARGNFESRRISHPLERWETPVEFGHEVPASHAPSAEPPQTMRRTWAFRDGHVMEVCTDPLLGVSTAVNAPQGLEAEEEAALACAVNPALAGAATSISSEITEDHASTLALLGASVRASGHGAGGGGEPGASASGRGHANGHAAPQQPPSPRAYQTSHSPLPSSPRRGPVRRVRVEPDDGKWLTMHSVLCLAPNVREATRLAHASLPKPKWSPPELMLREPIWTTWARYKASVTQEQTERFAEEIASRGLPRSVMEIDDRWQAAYGELDFDREKFPDPKAMVDRLHSMGFKVTLWVMPFCEENSDAYREGSALGHFVRADTPNGFGFKPGFFPWWNSSPVVALDVTSPEAVQWFTDRLRSLQTRYGIDGFKFDAGEPCFLPRDFKTKRPLAHPCEYTRGWVRNVASQFELAEVRTGHYTTDVGHLTRMGDRFSEWGLDNGLHSTVTTLLTSGVLGYPFCLPDMIGGNAYFGKSPNTELIVRWAQANALMPAVQFSIAPWDMSDEAGALVEEALRLREGVVEEIVRLTRQAAASLEPVCRPLWWLDPTDPETFTLDDQFTVGDNVIVAPVLRKGETTRDVYLTRGRWRDMLRPLEIYEGPRWIRNFPAPLNVLPCFQRVEESLLRPNKQQGVSAANAR